MWKKRLLNIHQTNISNFKNCLQIDSNLLPSAKLLGVLLDQSLTLDHMVTETCRIGFFKLFKLRNLRLFLSQKHKILLIKSFIISRLDYCNSLYACIPQYLLRKLKRPLNLSITYQQKIMTYPDAMHAATYYLLNIALTIKLCFMVSKILNNLAPGYLSNLFYVYKPFRKNLRSENDHTIINIGHHIEKIISRKMCIIWNSLPTFL